jgi:hypothetical protein
MKFARVVPTILSLSIGSLSVMTLAGCGSSGNGAPPPTAAKNIYAIQYSYNSTTYVEQDSLLVFSASATGSATPTSTLAMPSGFNANSVAVGPQGQIYVGGSQSGNNQDYGQIMEYPAGSSGSATPTVTLMGGSTGTFTNPDNMAVNAAGTLFVSSDDGTLEAFASGFTASSAPTQYLTWGVQTNPTTGNENFDWTGYYLGVDTAGDIFYMDGGNEVVDVFAAGATGTTAPVRTITGTNTNSFAQLDNIAVDGAGDVYLVNYNLLDDPNETNPEGNATSKKMQAMGRNGASRLTARPHDSGGSQEPTEIIEFAAGATGNATPTKRIGGAATNIVEPWALAVDAASNLYYADANGGYDTNDPLMLVEVFTSSATGNAPPAVSFSSSSYTWDNSGPVAVY